MEALSEIKKETVKEGILLDFKKLEEKIREEQIQKREKQNKYILSQFEHKKNKEERNKILSFRI